MGRDRRSPSGSPESTIGECPFCVGGLEAPEPYTVRAFANRWPPLVPGPSIDLHTIAADTPAESPTFLTAPARGAAEVVLYTSAHEGSLATVGVTGARAVIRYQPRRAVQVTPWSFCAARPRRSCGR